MKRNQGPTKNLLLVHAAALGEYVAHIDGDDYAKPRKLASKCVFSTVSQTYCSGCTDWQSLIRWGARWAMMANQLAEEGLIWRVL